MTQAGLCRASGRKDVAAGERGHDREQDPRRQRRLSMLQPAGGVMGEFGDEVTAGGQCSPRS